MTKATTNEEKKTCQVCGRAVRASKGLIAHHGYKRPGWGWQTSSCEGARYVPYEESCERLKEITEQVAVYLAFTQQELTDFLKTPPDTLTEYERNRTGGQETCVYQKPENFNLERDYSTRPRTYVCAYIMRKSAYVMRIKAITRDLEIMRKRIADWKPAK